MARKMKDSGIEWIGEIPEGWEVSQLKYATRWKSEKGCPDAPVYLSIVTSVLSQKTAAMITTT